PIVRQRRYAGCDTVLSVLYVSLSVHAAGIYSLSLHDALPISLTAPTTDVFDVQVSDGTLSAATTLTVNITGANDAPTITAEVASPEVVDTSASDTISAVSRLLLGNKNANRFQPTSQILRHTHD